MDVTIRGRGLASALGLNAPACYEAMRQGLKRRERVQIDGLSEKVDIPYYRIPDGAALFDAERFETLIAQVVREALESAQLSEAETRALPIFVGSSAFSISLSEDLYLKDLAKDRAHALALPLVDFDAVAMVLRRNFGLEGECYAFNTACTAGANALLYASRMIRQGRFPRALVLGMELANRTTLSGFSSLQLVAEEIRPFDRRRQGIILGEGLGAVVLEGKGEAAISLLEGASNCDPFSVTTANPDGSSIAALLETAFVAAGIRPEELVAVKAHATASPMNDKAEAAGLKRSLAQLPPTCAFKPFLGHTLGACGVNELILLLGALEGGELPAVPGFEEEDPELGFRPLEQAWRSQRGVYLLNYFGFGGNNTALLLRSRA
jgi:3-oxoacyl-(acyl-carrier-protein) synthase